MLYAHYVISRKAAAEMVQDVEPEYLDPTEQKYRELDKRIAQFEEAQNQQLIEREIQGLQSKYGDFDVKEVVTLAIQRGTTDLEGTYKQLAFDKMVAQRELEELGQIMVKQLKNRYNDPTFHKRFTLGVDRAKMKLYDVEQAAQMGIADAGHDKPLNTFGTREEKQKKSFSGFKV
jgi:hypothetical protein